MVTTLIGVCIGVIFFFLFQHEKKVERIEHELCIIAVIDQRNDHKLAKHAHVHVGEYHLTCLCPDGRINRYDTGSKGGPMPAKVIHLEVQACSWAADEIQRNTTDGEEYGLQIIVAEEEVVTADGKTMYMPGWYMLLSFANPVQPLFHYKPIGAIVPEEAKIRHEVRAGIKAMRVIYAKTATGGNGAPNG